MSDNPPNQTDAPGGWHQPQIPGTWREPEKKEPVAGWRVPALPKNLNEEPAQSGTWHLPKPEDTIFTSEDETAIIQTNLDAVVKDLPQEAVSIAPEDIAQFMAADAVGEEQPVQTDNALLAPEDLMYLLEHDDEEPEESVGMSELVALATLAAESGSQSDLEEDYDELDTRRLSPAERVMFGVQEKSQETESDAIEAELVDTESATVAGDPAEYARQQMAKLSGGTVDTSTPDAGGLSFSTDPSDPAEYARQQLAKLGGGAVELSTPPAQISPQEQELARQFRETERIVYDLRQQLEAGILPRETFESRLRELMILDEDNVWWMMGVSSDKWYRSENGQWIEATPPSLLAMDPDHSMAWLNTSPTATEVTQPTSHTPATQELRLDENFMPMPRAVPIDDPDYTVPNANVYGNMGQQNIDPYSQETVAGAAYTDPTVMAQPFAYGTVESAYQDGYEAGHDDYYEEAEPPDYDAYEAGEGEIYKEAAARRQSQTTRILLFVAAAGLALIFLLGAGFVAAALLWYNGIVDSWETQIAALADYQPTFQTVTLQDNQGNVIATLGRDGDDRRPVPLNEISDYMLHAVISSENARFYDDPGWDFFSIMRAFVQNYTSGEVTQGASTITQQVARNLVLQSSEVTASRKINEIVVAGELTRRYSKDQILYLYLNEVAFFGNQTYGVEAAAQFYFNKPASELNWPEAALLTAIIQAPANNEPVNNKQIAVDLMKVVMRSMVEVGCVNLRHDAPLQPHQVCVDRTMLEGPDLAPQIGRIEITTFRSREYSVKYPHFTQLVQAQLEDIFGSEIYSGGYTVTTTIDSNLQDMASQALRSYVAQNSLNRINAGTIMVTDPRNGAILALVGSPDFNNKAANGEIDFARTYNQPGSAVKPILYAAALSGVDRNGNGILESDFNEYLTPASVMWDVRTQYADGYTPINYDRRYHGAVSLRHALQNSYNVPAVKVLEFIGLDRFKAMSEALGIRFAAEAQFGLASSLGATEVRLIDMMKVYGTFANNGVRMPLYTIETIVDANGNPIGIPVREEPFQAISPQVAYLMQNILSDDPARAEQFGLNSALTIQGLPTQGVVAAKTGTTDDGRDLWTMGFTKNRVVGIWLGTYDDQPTLNTSGAITVAPLWNSVMRTALEGNPPSTFQPPAGIVTTQVCADTGTAPNETCANLRNEFFIDRQLPPSADQSFNQIIAVDSWTGLIANEFCPDNVSLENFVNITDPYAVQWLNTDPSGQAYANRIGLTTPVNPMPTAYCDQNTPLPVVRLSNPQGGQTLLGIVSIAGQVAAQNLARYQIEYAAANDPENFILIGQPATNQQTAPNSPLATWDTTTVPNGQYTVRLAVFSTSGGHIYRTASVVVNNPLPTATPMPTSTPFSTPLPFPTALPFDPIGSATPGAQGFPGGQSTPTVDPIG